MWLHDGACDTTVLNAWNCCFHLSSQLAVSKKIHRLKTDLVSWNKFVFGNVQRHIQNLEKKLSAIQNTSLAASSGSTDALLSGQEVEIRTELEKWYEREEIMWAQKSRQMWLLQGDRNTAYFHNIVKKRRAQNNLRRIKDDMGQWVEDYECIERLGSEHFERIFSATDLLVHDDLTDWLNDLDIPSITQEQSDTLLRSVTKEEVKVALFQLKPFKAPGPDGIPAMVYQRFWPFMQTDIFNLVRDFFEGKVDLSLINATYISLIPKIDLPETFKDFRPISLCNVIYKVISKVLVNRLQVLMDGLISPYQNAFIKGRLISDNIFLASELMSFIHNAKRGKSSWGALKVDMAKAYDRVSWVFLAAVLKRMNFPGRLVDCIMNCVTSSSFSLLLNGQISSQLAIFRGLRQGDPLSPYLFIICMNVLSGLLSKAERNRDLQGIQFARRGPSISHLLYADDLVVFFKADSQSVCRLKNLLDDFCCRAGLSINNQKSCLVLSPNSSGELKSTCASVLEVPITLKLGKYLGVFVDDRQDFRRNFEDLVDKIQNRLAGWKSRLLSQAARLTLIKSVIQSDPVYKFSCFQAPKRVLSSINSTMTNFFWGYNGDRPRMHLLNQQILFHPKWAGGLGLRDASLVNRALLAKQFWRIIQNPESITSAWVRNKYVVHHSDFQFKENVKGSLAWKGVKTNSHIITDHLRWRLGRGDRVDVRSKFWDNHLGGSPSGIFVNDLLRYDSYTWDLNKIRIVFSEAEANQLVDGPNPVRDRPDSLVWTPVATGSYTTAAGYDFLLKSDHPEFSNPLSFVHMFPWKDFWRTKVPMRILLFAWKAWHGALPTFANLNRHHLKCDVFCPFCGGSDDSVDHVFLHCHFSRAVWFGLDISLRSVSSRFRTTQQWLNFWVLRWKKNPDRFAVIWLTVLLTMDVIWRLRNEGIHKRQHVTPQKAIIMIIRTREFYRSVFDPFIPSACSAPDYGLLSSFIASSSNGRSILVPGHTDVGPVLSSM